MNRSEIVAFLPCRAGSERVPEKNTRPFAGVRGGLLAIKLAQLLRTEGLARVVVDSNDPTVISLAEQTARERGASKLQVRWRPRQLGTPETSTDDLIAYALETVECEDLLWTHVTSPFMDSDGYSSAIRAYLGRGSSFDSLMGVQRLQAFLWTEEGPRNYDRAVEKWPRTQTLRPLFEVNSAVFLVPRDVGLRHKDRIGAHPQMFELTRLQSLDIDWITDFELAEQLYVMRQTGLPVHA